MFQPRHEDEVPSRPQGDGESRIVMNGQMQGKCAPTNKLCCERNARPMENQPERLDSMSCGDVKNLVT
jgi:hypothetical protein